MDAAALRFYLVETQATPASQWKVFGMSVAEAEGKVLAAAAHGAAVAYRDALGAGSTFPLAAVRLRCLVVQGGTGLCKEEHHMGW